jgi:toxin-antitoxin system PIN domain toxin
MRFLIDTNILVHAVNSGSPFHAAARAFLHRHRQARTPWCLTWPIVYEFLRVSTHPRVFPNPLTTAQALAFAGALIAPEEVIMLAPTSRHFEVLALVAGEIGYPAGNLFHDIHTATLMREHGIPEVITADTDFLQFPFLRVTNPLHHDQTL